MKRKILPSLKVQFAVILVCIITVFMIFNIITGHLISNLLYEKNLQYSKTISKKLVREFEYTDKRIIAASSNLQFDMNIQKYFKEDLEWDTIKKVEKKVSALKLFYEDIFDIALVDDKFVNSTYLQRETADEIIYKSEKNKKIKCIGLYEQTYLEKNITMLLFESKVYDMDIANDYGEQLGNIILSINIDTALKNFEPQNGEEINFVIFDKHNNFYPINCSRHVAKGILDEIGEISNIDNMIVSDKNNIIVEPVSGMDLYVVSIINKERSQRDVNYILKILSVIGCIFIVILCYGFVIIYMNTARPIQRIEDYLKNIISGNYKKLKEKVVVAKGNKEIVKLAEDLNNMIEEINNLTEQLVRTSNNLYKAEIEKKRAEISYLRSQINPHFLYNTLETMKGIAMSNNLSEIAVIAQCLGDIFRYSIKGSSEVVLEEELKMIKAYIDIQVLKFGEKVTVFYNINEDTTNVIIPKMIMQPIVENAFIHAIEKNTDDTILYIGTKIYDNNLIIIIQDDGKGMEQEILNKITNSLDYESDCNTNHVGLSNVHKRIKMIYGSEFGVEVESEVSEGTKISLRLPVIRKQLE